MQMTLAFCDCEIRYQDLMYGKRIRVHCLVNSGKRHETTGYFRRPVCSQRQAVGINIRIDIKTKHVKEIEKSDF